MLNEYTGYLLGLLSALIILPIYYFKTKNRTHTMGRCFMMALLILYSTIYITNIIFPMPIQPSVIQSGFHEKDNFLIPFSELSKFYDNYVLSGEMTAKTFVKEYLLAVWRLCLQIIPIGLFVKIIFKYKLKQYLLFEIITIVAFELLKMCCNFITTVNYISFVTEHLLYSFISFLLGFYLYYVILWIAKKIQHSSNIMAAFYQLLK